jgi:ATP-dependent DNA ligase
MEIRNSRRCLKIDSGNTIASRESQCDVAVHWVEPKLVAEITYLTWAADNLLRHTVYVGLRGR